MDHKSFEKLTWSDVGCVNGGACPDIMNLMDLIKVIPETTADCEMGFNVMKSVKSDWRSRVNADTLSYLLLVHLTSPDILDYDPSPAVEMWHSVNSTVAGAKNIFWPVKLRNPKMLYPGLYTTLPYIYFAKYYDTSVLLQGNESPDNKT